MKFFKVGKRFDIGKVSEKSRNSVFGFVADKLQINRMYLLVKSNTLRSKSCKKQKDIQTEDNNIHGLQKKLKLM